MRLARNDECKLSLRGRDDALDVWACHGVGGTLGPILVGVFAASAVNGLDTSMFGEEAYLL